MSIFRLILPTLVLALGATTFLVNPTTHATVDATSQPAADFVGPITYFQQNCATCHGDYGANRVKGWQDGETEESLRDWLDEMAFGHANAPIEGNAFDAVLAYQRSMADRLPFVYITRVDDSQITGEATPGTVLILHTAQGDQPIRFDGHTFTAPLGARITARTNRGSTQVEIKPGMHTHNAPYGQ